MKAIFYIETCCCSHPTMTTMSAEVPEGYLIVCVLNVALCNVAGEKIQRWFKFPRVDTKINEANWSFFYLFFYCDQTTNHHDSELLPTNYFVSVCTHSSE